MPEIPPEDRCRVIDQFTDAQCELERGHDGMHLARGEQWGSFVEGQTEIEGVGDDA
jgi:hypothetical protein